MARVKSKVATVTGTSSGIGAACAQGVFVGTNGASASQQAATTRNAGYGAGVIEVDISDEASTLRMLDLVGERYGGLVISHNNAADTLLSSTKEAPVQTLDVAGCR